MEFILNLDMSKQQCNLVLKRDNQYIIIPAEFLSKHKPHPCFSVTDKGMLEFIRDTIDAELKSKQIIIEGK